VANFALLDCIKTKPDPDDVDTEVAGSIATLRQLARLRVIGLK
jgi:hypothetical protein